MKFMNAGWVYHCRDHGYWSSDENDFPDTCPEGGCVGAIVMSAEPIPAGARARCVSTIEGCMTGKDRKLHQTEVTMKR